MKNSLLVDPTFNEFKEMQNIASNIEGLYDKHNENELVEDKSFWNDNYMEKEKANLINNFSPERIKHLQNVIEFLRPVELTNTSKSTYIRTTYNKDSIYNDYSEQKKIDKKKDDYIVNKTILGAGMGAGIGCLAGGVTVSSGLIAGSISSGVIIGLTIGALTGATIGSLLAK